MYEYTFKATLFAGVIAATAFCSGVQASQATSATGLSYDYVRVSYGRAEFSDGGGAFGRVPPAGKRVELAGSLEVGRGFHLWGGWEAYDEDHGWIGVPTD